MKKAINLSSYWVLKKKQRKVLKLQADLTPTWLLQVQHMTKILGFNIIQNCKEQEMAKVKGEVFSHKSIFRFYPPLEREGERRRESALIEAGLYQDWSFIWIDFDVNLILYFLFPTPREITLHQVIIKMSKEVPSVGRKWEPEK